MPPSERNPVEAAVHVEIGPQRLPVRMIFGRYSSSLRYTGRVGQHRIQREPLTIPRVLAKQVVLAIETLRLQRAG